MKQDPRILRTLLEDHQKNGDYEKFAAVARKLAKADPDSRLRWKSMEATALYRLARYKESLPLSRECLKAEPSVHSALRVADCLEALGGNQKEVPALLEQALKLQQDLARKGKWPPEHAMVARILVRLGRLDEAEKVLKRTARYPAERPEFWLPFVRGELALARNDFPAALADFETAMIANPKSEVPKLRVLQSLTALGRDPRRVKKLAAEIKKVSPDAAQELKRLTTRSPAATP
jgi:tetratricopeptide (TPR) repeat protein